MKLTVETNVKQLRANFDGAAKTFDKRITAAANMAMSMIVEESKADIEAAGAFGAAFTDDLTGSVEKTGSGIKISITHTDPRAELFEEGGIIEGNPLLWIPLSNTDAFGIRASSYPNGLFSVTRRDGLPLLFSVADKKPRYFGITKVHIPKKFHLHEIATRVMENFKQIFAATQ